MGICHRKQQFIKKVMEIPLVQRMVSLEVLSYRYKPYELSLNGIFADIETGDSYPLQAIFTTERVACLTENMHIKGIRAFEEIHQKLQESRLVKEILLESLDPSEYMSYKRNGKYNRFHKGDNYPSLFFRTIPLSEASQADELIRLIYETMKISDENIRGWSGDKISGKVFEEVAKRNTKLRNILRIK